MDGSHPPATTLDPVPLKRRRFTGEDVERMIRAGILDDKERLELIHGELIEMAFEGGPHWDAKAEMVNWLARRLPAFAKIAPDGPLRLNKDQEPEPDFYLYPATKRVNQVRGPDTLLVCEIADTSLKKDLNPKAPLYAAYGVALYWIVDVIEKRTLVFSLEGDAYPPPRSVPFDAPLVAPGIAEPLIIALLVE